MLKEKKSAAAPLPMRAPTTPGRPEKAPCKAALLATTSAR